MRLLSLVASLAVGFLPLLVRGQVSGLSGCGQTCFNGMLAKSTELGCSSPDMACLCPNQAFHWGIHDCTAAVCASTSEDPESPRAAINNYCTSLSQNAAAASTVSAAAAPPAVVQSTTVTPTLPNPSSALATSSQSTSSASTKPASTTSATPSFIIATPSFPSSLTSGTTALVATTTPTAPQADAVPDPEASTSLTTAGKVGIGIGAAAALVLLFFVPFFLMRARRNRQPNGTKISSPLPGSGRTYPDAVSEKAYADLELTSRKYEDMLPRQKPRHMV